LKVDVYRVLFTTLLDLDIVDIKETHIMSDLFAARAQMGTSLAFHIIFSALGVGLPLLQKDQT
jgi:hypothetical protein